MDLNYDAFVLELVSISNRVASRGYQENEASSRRDCLSYEI